MEPLSKRHADILDILGKRGYVAIEEIVSAFNVTPQTVRRDLQDLADRVGPSLMRRKAHDAAGEAAVAVPFGDNVVHAGVHPASGGISRNDSLPRKAFRCRIAVASTGQLVAGFLPCPGRRESRGRGAPGPAAGGAGAYASSMLLPHLAKNPDAILARVATTTSLSAANAQRKFGFESVTTDADEVLADPDIDAVFVVTRHHSHAGFVCRALEAGKAVFVEKPLALTRAEVDGILDVVEGTGNDRVMVGFNRRFARCSPTCASASGRPARRCRCATRSTPAGWRSSRTWGRSWSRSRARPTRTARRSVPTTFSRTATSRASRRRRSRRRRSRASPDGRDASPTAATR